MADWGEPGARPPSWALRTNRFKQRLLAGEPALAMWLTLAVPALVEMLGTTDLDAVIADLEHASYGLVEIENVIRAGDAVGITTLVRVPSTDPALVTRLLDAGAYGIVFPLVASREDAEAAVACLRYQPHGRRGWGGAHTRHARWQGSYAGAEARPGSGQPAATVYSREYVEKAEGDLLSVLIVETEAGVAAIDEIVAVDGVDAVLFGWGDYALENGFGWPQAQEAALRVFRACRSAGVGCALTPGSKLGDSFFAGCFYIVGIDSLLASAALSDAVAQAQQAIGVSAGG